MSTNKPQNLSDKDLFFHIDMGFINRRLILTALGSEGRQYFNANSNPDPNHLAQLGNDHLLVTMLLDLCDATETPTLLELLASDQPRGMFRSTERLEPCPEIDSSPRVSHGVSLDLNFGKPVTISYHTEHLCSSTGTMTLREGYLEGYVESIVGVLHERDDHFEIEPLVIGAPWLDHPRNKEDSSEGMWLGQIYGEVLPEDIEQFERMSEIKISDANQWLDTMKSTPESKVKSAFAALLAEPTKKDWGGEQNDHFSGNVVIGGRRRTAAFLLKGPSNFREMTLDMCGKRADQIYRLANSHADVSIVQHSHMIGEAVRATLRAMIVAPGQQTRKYCLIDGQATYRIMKAYGFLD